MRTLSSSIAVAMAIGLVSVTTAHGQARIDDCEKIQAADAYNQCLAKFGPESKVKSVEPERPGDIKASSAEAAAGAGPIKGRGGHSAGRRRGGSHSSGRKRASFSVHRHH